MELVKEYPPPLVPPDVDLRDFYFMPLDVGRLRDSRLAYAVSGDGFRSAVLLWCACWHQLPASSLPDDDVELAHLAGFGRVISEWLKYKEEALHGFVKCSDGRIYHQHIANEAMKSWREKQLHRWSRECDRIRKENKTREKNKLGLLPIPEKPYFPKENISSPSENENFPQENDITACGIPSENPLKGQGQGQGQKDSVVLLPADAQEEKTDTVNFPEPIAPETQNQPTSSMQWVEYFVNHLGFQIHEAQTGKTVPMFADWVKDGVTVEIVELATLDVNSWLAKKSNGQQRPSSPTAYKTFVQTLMFEKQKSQLDRAGSEAGFQENSRGNYATKTNNNEAYAGRKPSLAEQADQGLARVRARKQREQEERDSIVN